MKTAGRENPNRWARVFSNRARGAAGQNPCLFKWAAKQEKLQSLEELFFLTSTFIELFSDTLCQVCRRLSSPPVGHVRCSKVKFSSPDGSLSVRYFRRGGSPKRARRLAQYEHGRTRSLSSLPQVLAENGLLKWLRFLREKESCWNETTWARSTANCRWLPAWRPTPEAANPREKRK